MWRSNFLQCVDCINNTVFDHFVKYQQFATIKNTYKDSHYQIEWHVQQELHSLTVKQLNPCIIKICMDIELWFECKANAHP